MMQQRSPVEVLAFWRARPGALMILGRADGSVPKTGSVRTQGSLGRVGIFRAEFWQPAEPADTNFLAVVRLPDNSDPADDATVAIRGSRSGDRDFLLALQRPCSETEFGTLAANLAGAQATQVARFLLAVISPQDGRDARLPDGLLNAFLSRAATPDGCVELILAVPGRLVLLQGWGSVDEDDLELLLPSASWPRYPASTARFARPDVPAPASGIVLALPPESFSALSGLETVFIFAGNRLLSRNIVEKRVLDSDSSIGQLRHLLPRLTCTPAVMDLFRIAAQAQYEGHDTLAGSGKPVRIAVDIAVAVERAGTFLSGWIFDPAAEIAELSLCWTGGGTRIDHALVRVAREDVCAAFRSDPHFPPAPPEYEPGFAASCIEVPAPVASAHLRLTFNDGELAFVPVRPATVWSQGVRRALLQSIDMHKTSGLAIVEQHLAPFLSRTRSAPEQPMKAVLLGPVDRSHAIVVPLRGPVPPRAFLSSFLRDKALHYEQIVLVCGPEWANGHQQTLRDLVHFYELPASIIVLSGEAQPLSALAAAASFTQAESFLYISADGAGAEPGWRRGLYEGVQGYDVACPTILYEDQSIRFAGDSQIRFSARAPYVRTHTAGAGLSGMTVSRGDTPMNMTVGSLACCLIPRPIITLLECSASLTTSFGQETGFFLSLADAGVSRAWVPSVTVTVPEDDGDIASLPRLIDGWILREGWGGTASCAF
ncbi:MAG: hypothetical protein RQ966_12735 [Acetobacteraceae bacterium]|nr:hypothetical protein [Acetobacteraceae bacterium]